MEECVSRGWTHALRNRTADYRVCRLHLGVGGLHGTCDTSECRHGCHGYRRSSGHTDDRDKEDQTGKDSGATGTHAYSVAENTRRNTYGGRDSRARGEKASLRNSRRQASGAFRCSLCRDDHREYSVDTSLKSTVTVDAGAGDHGAVGVSLPRRASCD